MNGEDDRLRTDNELRQDEELRELREFKEKLKDPVFLGTIFSKLAEERASTNMLMKEINAKLDKLVELQTKSVTAEKEIMLPEVDEQIMRYLRKKGKACAEEVQMQFGYKGRNAASARLNMLFKQRVIEKVQVGKKVFFTPK
ncbi:hypothetical protein HY991_00255 [Candidatus Micrarchaeota archaeon]|nr:hypothetical protein [Candidatus Micrarchaeota archaeon]